MAILVQKFIYITVEFDRECTTGTLRPPPNIGAMLQKLARIKMLISYLEGNVISGISDRPDTWPGHVIHGSLRSWRRGLLSWGRLSIQENCSWDSESFVRFPRYAGRSIHPFFD